MTPGHEAETVAETILFEARNAVALRAALAWRDVHAVEAERPVTGSLEPVPAEPHLPNVT